jgi:hypothetical protein
VGRKRLTDLARLQLCPTRIDNLNTVFQRISRGGFCLGLVTSIYCLHLMRGVSSAFRCVTFPSLNL